MKSEKINILRLFPLHMEMLWFQTPGNNWEALVKPHFLPVGWKGAPAWQRQFPDTLGFPEQMTGVGEVRGLRRALLRKDKESADMRISHM